MVQGESACGHWYMVIHTGNAVLNPTPNPCWYAEDLNQYLWHGEMVHHDHQEAWCLSQHFGPAPCPLQLHACSWVQDLYINLHSLHSSDKHLDLLNLGTIHKLVTSWMSVIEDTAHAEWECKEAKAVKIIIHAFLLSSQLSHAPPPLPKPFTVTLTAIFIF